MIYVIGIDTDKTFIHFLKEASRHGIDNLISINIRAIILNGGWRLALPDDGNSYIRVKDEEIVLDPNSSYYVRGMDLSTYQTNLNLFNRWRFFMNSMWSWLESIPGTVINRPGSDAHNSTKPLHEYFVSQFGLRVPPSITSSNRNDLLDFIKQGPTLIKAISGVRANSKLITDSDLDDFNSKQGPIHLQRYIPGKDIRVHIVGNNVHSELIQSEEVDYRKDKNIDFQNFVIPKDLSAKLIHASKAFDLIFTGWDFKLSSDGDFWCLECNPMPGYHGYDIRCGGKITKSLVEYLNYGSK